MDRDDPQQKDKAAVWTVRMGRKGKEYILPTEAPTTTWDVEEEERNAVGTAGAGMT